MFFDDAPQLDMLARSLILGPAALLWVVAMVRIFGLGTFSKMTAFDFVSTVAIGSLLANAAVATNWLGFLQSLIAMLVILGLQEALALFRSRSKLARSVIENDPVLLMRDGQWFENNIKSVRMTKADIWGKLREANVVKFEDARAVVLETTGDISVLHGENLEPVILTGVKDPQD